MIDYKDLNPKDFELTENQKENLKNLAILLNPLEREFIKSPGGFLFTFPSGFRSISDHYRIYRLKGIESPPLGSKHLTGEAADISDPLGVLYAWLKSCSEEYLASFRLYYEVKDKEARVHAQSVAPHSGHRFFIPA